MRLFVSRFRYVMRHCGFKQLPNLRQLCTKYELISYGICVENKRNHIRTDHELCEDFCTMDASRLTGSANFITKNAILDSENQTDDPPSLFIGRFRRVCILQRPDDKKNGKNKIKREKVAVDRKRFRECEEKIMRVKCATIIACAKMAREGSKDRVCSFISTKKSHWQTINAKFVFENGRGHMNVEPNKTSWFDMQYEKHAINRQRHGGPGEHREH